MLRLVCISDTHGSHAEVSLPAGDILLHAGDVSKRGTEAQIQSFLDWFSAQPHRHKVFIAGNHDFLAENQATRFREMIPANCIYLENSGVEIEGIRIWGSPISPWFYDWAFNRRRGAEIRAYWEKIPTDTDLLLTHGPPAGLGDRTFRGEEVGCQDLREELDRIQPQVHLFGHIHEAYGEYQLGNTRCLNVSIANLKYQMVHPPVVIDWDT
jgi:Icc-related predicted phosphoesterase